MATHAHKGGTSLLDVRIDLLNKNASEPSPARQIFRTVSAILALVRDKMIKNKDSVELSEYCFNMCEVLKTVIYGKNADDLSEPVRTALNDLGRVIREIERILRRGASMPLIEYNKGKIEGYKLEVQEILNALNAPRSFLDDNLAVNERSTLSAPIGPYPHGIATITVFEACGRLIRREFAPQELFSLIEVIIGSKDAGDTIHRLPEDDAQTFIDVIDEALDKPGFSPWTRKKCLKSLYRACGRHGLLPRSLKIPVCYDRTRVALYRGGFADVWKGEHYGRDVAVKVIRTYSNSDLQKIIGRFCKEVVTWRTLRHPNVLPLIGVTMSENQFAMISDWMANGNINEFVKACPDANRLELLGDVAKGLIYIHSQGMIHGDLKGANVLIDQSGHACLADFGLLTVVSDPANLLSSGSYAQGGTARWMSPELIAPHRFGFKNSRPTKPSDCYAFGMVIYETISGHLPFHEDTDLTVSVKVLEGKRPPRRVRFTKDLWKMMEQCWRSQSSDRPSVEDVLRCLETSSHSSEPLSPEVDEGMETDSGSEHSFSHSSFAHSIDLQDQSLEFDSTQRSTSLLSTDKPRYLPSSVLSEVSPKISLTPPPQKRKADPQNPSFDMLSKSDTLRWSPPRLITSLDPSSSNHRTSADSGGPQPWKPTPMFTSAFPTLSLPLPRLRSISPPLFPADESHRSRLIDPGLSVADLWRVRSDGGGVSNRDIELDQRDTNLITRKKRGPFSPNLPHPQSDSSKFLLEPPQVLTPFTSPGYDPTSASDLANPSSEPGSSTALILTGPDENMSSLSLDDLDPSTLPPGLKKEGGDWFAVFNPKVKRVLDVSLVHTLAHESVICCVHFSADGKYLATGCNQTAKIFDTKTGAKTCVLTDETADNTNDLYIRSVRFSPDGKLLATGADNKTIRIWDIVEKRIRNTFQGHTQEIYSLAFSSDGRFIVSGSGDRTTRIWDMTDGSSKTLAIIDLPDNVDARVTSVAISSDGRLAAAGSIDAVVRIWDARTGDLLERLRGHRDSVCSVAFTPDARGLVSGSLDKTLKYWDVSRLANGSGALKRDSLGGEEDPGVRQGDSACTMNFTGHKDYVVSVAVSHDGQWVVSGSKDHGVQFWDTKTAIPQLMLHGHKNTVISVDLSPAGNMLATGSGDREARIWRYTAIS